MIFYQFIEIGPNSSEENNIFFIKLIHNMVNNTSDNVIILGDFIYKTIDWDNLQTIYSDISDMNNKEEKILNCVLDNYLILEKVF